MNCSRNDVVLLPIPFTDLTSRKVRPAVVIGRKGEDLFLVPISSQLPNTDFPLQDWRAAVIVKIKLTNLFDLAFQKRKASKAKPRHVMVKALVDTGATRLYLKPSVIKRLG